MLVWSEPIDLRKGVDGLSALVRRVGEDVYSGHFYVFVSRRADRLKVLTWQRGGFVLLYKLLDGGRFRLPETASAQLDLDGAELAMLLDGVDLRTVRRTDAWKPKKRPEIRKRGIDIAPRP